MNKMAGTHQKHKGKNGGEGHVIGSTHVDLNKRANADNNFTIPSPQSKLPIYSLSGLKKDLSLILLAFSVFRETCSETNVQPAGRASTHTSSNELYSNSAFKAQLISASGINATVEYLSSPYINFRGIGLYKLVPLNVLHAGSGLMGIVTVF